MIAQSVHEYLSRIEQLKKTVQEWMESDDTYVKRIPVETEAR